MTPTTGSASTRAGVELLTLRVATIVLGVIAIVAGASAVIIFASSKDALSATAFAFSMGVAVGLPCLAGVLAPWVSEGWLRRFAIVIVVEYVFLLTLLLGFAGLGTLPGGEVPWYFTAPAIPAAAAMIAGGRTLAWWVMGVSSGILLAVRALTEPELTRLLSSDLIALASAAGIVLLFDVLLAAARTFDREAADALAARARQAAEEARGRAAGRFAALVHDELLATLLLATQDRPHLRPAVARDAQRARRLLRELEADDAVAPVAAATLVERIRAMIADAAPDARLHLTAGGDPARSADDPEYPAPVASAILGAAEQALANATRHANAQRIEVRVELTREVLRVEVADDGRGFDPLSVPASRMGIASSILDRLSGVAGGAAEVVSAPGAGTVVTLAWSRDEGPRAGGDRAASSRTSRPARAGILAPGDRAARRALVIASTGYLLAMAVLAALASVRTGGTLVHVAAWCALAVALAVQGWRSLDRPAPWRTAVAVVSALGVAALSWVPVRRDPTTFGDLWFVPALALMLVVLAVRGRWWAAVLAGATAAGVTIAGAVVYPVDQLDLVAGTVRLCAILVVSLTLVRGIAAMQARSAAMQARQVEHAAAAAAREAARRLLRERSAEAESLIGRMLDRLAGPEPLTAADRAECAALEGRLRDQYRAGRLARPPLTESAMRARRRGVDVVLLDDAARALSEADLDRAAAWIADRLDAVDEGMFTGRILPHGQHALASAVTEHAAETLAGGSRREPSEEGDAATAGLGADPVPSTL